jgi:hypothetical protein
MELGYAGSFGYHHDLKVSNGPARLFKLGPFVTYIDIRIIVSKDSEKLKGARTEVLALHVGDIVINLGSGRRSRKGDVSFEAFHGSFKASHEIKALK